MKIFLCDLLQGGPKEGESARCQDGRTEEVKGGRVRYLKDLAGGSKFILHHFALLSALYRSDDYFAAHPAVGFFHPTAGSRA